MTKYLVAGAHVCEKLAKNHYLTAESLAVEPATSRSQYDILRHSMYYTAILAMISGVDRDVY